MKFYLSIFFIGILLFACSKTIQLEKFDIEAENVFTFGNSAERNFYFNENIEIEKEPDWDYSIYGSFSNSSFAAYDTLLFVADLGGRVTVLDINTGKKNGQIKYKGSIEQAPIIDKNLLIFIVNNFDENYSSLYVYDFVHGKEIREFGFQGKATNELIYQNENIFILSDFGKLYKVSKYGMLVWEKDFVTRFNSDPAADTTNLFAVSLDGYFYSIKLDDGEITYKTKVSENVQSGIIIQNGNAYFGNDAGTIYSISLNSGIVNWSFDTKFKITAMPACDNKAIYFGNLNGDIYSLSLNDGTVNWERQTDGLINSTPLIFNNVIVQPNQNTEVEIINKFNGEVIDRLLFDGRCRTTPLYYKDKLFLGIDKDDVFCFTVNKN